MENNTESSSANGLVKVEENKEKSKSKDRDGVRIILLSGAAALTAGVITSAVARRRARQYLASKGHELEQLPESGTALALKALCYATLITVGSFSLAVFGLCRCFGMKNMDDLRIKIKQTRKSSPPNPDDRTEFENLSDFLNYLNERYGKTEKGKS